jgi:chemotaxis protein histidine kinase CheA
MLSDETTQRLIGKFRAETIRQLAILRTNLLRLVDTPDDNNILSAMVLSCHTIKGNLGTIGVLEQGFIQLDKIASQLELTMLSLYNGEISLNQTIVNLLDQGISQLELEFTR